MLRLQTRSILYFDMVRQTASIREAARRLNVAASAVHRQIVNLEEEIGAPLFDRLPDGLRLTASGEVLTRHVQTILKDARRTERELGALRGVRSGEIRVATVESAEFELLPRAIARLQAGSPGVQVVSRTMSANSIPDVIRSAEADIGLSFAVPRRPEYRTVASHRFSFGVIMPPDHELAGEEQLTVGRCVHYPVVLPISSETFSPSSNHALIWPLLRSVEERLHVIAQTSSIRMARTLVSETGAIAFQNRFGMEREIATRSLIHRPLLAPALLWTDFEIFVRSGRSDHHSVGVFAEILRDELSKY